MIQIEIARRYQPFLRTFHEQCRCSICAQKVRSIPPSRRIRHSDLPCPAISIRSADAGVYGTLCVLSSVVAVIYAIDYHKHRASASKVAKPWAFQGCFLLCMVAGLVLAALKCAFFLAFRWKQKSPELNAAAQSSSLLFSLLADMFTMYCFMPRTRSHADGQL